MLNPFSENYKLMKNTLTLAITLFVCSTLSAQKITMSTLLQEMIDLERLASTPDHTYQSIQFSSYDRRSTAKDEPGWFGNRDGFGIPNGETSNFLETITPPGEDLIGTYLICDVDGPGVMLRAWTARISGTITVYLDGNSNPFYSGNAQDFFWNLPSSLSEDLSVNVDSSFRQFDGLYFPILFEKNCRIEWTGNISESHFYYVGIRKYEPGTPVRTTTLEELKNNQQLIQDVAKKLKNPALVVSPGTLKSRKTKVSAHGITDLIIESGEKKIDFLSVKLDDIPDENLMRQLVLNIYFDSASVPQVNAPLGDFFGSTPGINPYVSLPFSVLPDGKMICRFHMPFRNKVRVELQNFSNTDIQTTVEYQLKDYEWNEKSMYFHSLWRTTNNFSFNHYRPMDIPYLMAFGEGRLVGTSTHLFNPSNALSSWGNWWGEGDEKIYIDGDKFPSFYGTGSEDYYSYSWSSSDIFSYAYIGQPRNDGPGNRGHVSNYRWHILDDIPFKDRMAFFMELYTHGSVAPISYSSISYLYARPGIIDDHRMIVSSDVQAPEKPVFKPLAYLGSAGHQFYEAEDLMIDKTKIKMKEDYLWSNNNILVWKPSENGDEITFSLNKINHLKDEERFRINFCKNPQGGKIQVFVNGKIVKFEDKDFIDLFQPYRTIAKSYGSEKDLKWKRKNNEITIRYIGGDRSNEIGIDFFWFKD